MYLHASILEDLQSEPSALLWKAGVERDFFAHSYSIPAFYSSNINTKASDIKIRIHFPLWHVVTKIAKSFCGHCYLVAPSLHISFHKHINASSHSITVRARSQWYRSLSWWISNIFIFPHICSHASASLNQCAAWSVTLFWYVIIHIGSFRKMNCAANS